MAIKYGLGAPERVWEGFDTYVDLLTDTMYALNEDTQSWYIFARNGIHTDEFGNWLYDPFDPYL